MGTVGVVRRYVLYHVADEHLDKFSVLKSYIYLIGKIIKMEIKTILSRLCPRTALLHSKTAVWHYLCNQTSGPTTELCIYGFCGPVET